MFIVSYSKFLMSYIKSYLTFLLLVSLGEQLQDKSEEIARLRSELVALENRDPPYYQKSGSGEIQRKYQSEIQNLELYISQLQKEQQTLQDEKDIVKEKVRCSQSFLQCTKANV